MQEPAGLESRAAAAGPQIGKRDASGGCVRQVGVPKATGQGEGGEVRAKGHSHVVVGASAINPFFRRSARPRVLEDPLFSNYVGGVWRFPLPTLSFSGLSERGGRCEAPPSPQNTSP